MRTGYRKGWVVDLDTGEILRKFGDVAARGPKAGTLRGALARSGQVKTFTFEATAQVAAELPPRIGAQGTLFDG